ncbi:scoloptoxin SSD976-like [Penaeus monodon]|uniref:scoloptoxin SSD976-like n=1 Tax=Penaeus monodon TaxID=6687 RepID=UPI0018A792F4|nr:scoloptoxin SSD976-like [Penaeus monodon]XP_037783711.1 scoloptoxin SSD976-like [Penaeus monodon]
MKRKKAKLILEPVEGCTCSRSLSRIPKMESEGRAVEFDAFYDTDAKAAGKCWFNRRWSVNSVVAILEDHCIEIACVYDEVAARAVLQARFLPGCECGERTTALATETYTNPPTENLNSPPTEPPSTPAACDYAQFSAEHSMLLRPNLECNAHRTGVSEAERQEILEVHNTLRAKVARGEEGEGDAGPQPSGADIRELVWNDELAQVAQAWAEQCKGGHDGYAKRRICSRSYAVGQNVFRKWSQNPDSVWTEAIHAWYKEVANMPNTFVDKFTGSPPSGKMIGHYTQLVWGATNEIGCGAVEFSSVKSSHTYSESKIYVCNYGRNGNSINSPVYTRGPTASQCSAGTSSRYPGLCL